jgi:hypothetical protein
MCLETQIGEKFDFSNTFVYIFIPELFTHQKTRWRVMSFPVVLSGANATGF